MIPKKINKISVFVLILFFTSLVPLRVQAIETSTAQDDQRQEEEKTKELEIISEPLPTKKWLQLKFGGWESTTWVKYKNTDNNNPTEDTLKSYLKNDLRLWLSSSSLDKYFTYIRIKQTYTTRLTGTGYTGIGDDYEGALLDMAYITFNFNWLDNNFNTKLGRQYFYLGRGIAFSGVHDGAKIKFKFKDYYLKLIAAHSNPQDDNIDTSVPNYDKKEDRFYYGLEAVYTYLSPLILYGFLFIQRDASDEYPSETTNQSYLYNSEYLGFGFDGNTKKGIQYWLEVIKEWGRTFNDTAIVAGDKARIDALGLDCGIRYTFVDMLTRPSLEFEYAYGSGDRDRQSVIKTYGGGNRYGTDRNFSYFGYFATGYAFSGRLSNLSLSKIEATVTPFQKIKNLKDLDVGVKYFSYRKVMAESAIYDDDATVASADVGDELDMYLYWKPSKNFYCSAQYGIFYPGDAYPKATNDPTRYLLIRTTLTF